MLFVKSLNAFLRSQFHPLFTSLSWAHLRVLNLYTLINLAYCWIYCKLKLHSSPNTIFSTVEIIWKYFLTLVTKNNKSMPRYTNFQLFFSWQPWVTVLSVLVWKVLVLIFINAYQYGYHLNVFLNGYEISLEYKNTTKFQLFKSYVSLI